MTEMTEEICALLKNAMGDAKPAEDEYIHPESGLIYCRKCDTPRQLVVKKPFGSGYFFPRTMCRCQSEADKRRKEAEEQHERMERIKRHKAHGLQGISLYDYTFANDNGTNPVMNKARSYVRNWPEAFKKNLGLLLFGDIGTGKSFFAGCIANALLEQEVPVLMTSFPTILNRLAGLSGEDRVKYFDRLDEYDLLIIDDLGVERDTSYASEQIYNVIDGRYRCKKPMIITTNLKLEELKVPSDLLHARIYDRILERCAPILFDGPNFRKAGAAEIKATAREILNH